MAEYSNVGRVMGRRVGRMAEASVARPARTPEQRAQDEIELLASYETWRAQREARIEARKAAFRASYLRHKDLLM